MTERRSGKRWALPAAVATLAGVAATAWWVRRNYVAITVEGMSMSPALYDGEKVLIRRGIRGLSTGRIVVLSRPDPVSGWRHNPPAGRELDATGWYIKRVVAVGGEPYPESVKRTGLIPSGHVVVVGDHPRSEDSKQHGACPIDQILGVQIRKLNIPGAVGTVIPSPQTWSDEDIDGMVFDESLPADLGEGTEGSLPPESPSPSQVSVPAASKPDEPEAVAEEPAKTKPKPKKRQRKPKPTAEATDQTDTKSTDKAAKATKKTAAKATEKTATKPAAENDDQAANKPAPKPKKRQRKPKPAPEAATD